MRTGIRAVAGTRGIIGAALLLLSVAVVGLFVFSAGAGDDGNFRQDFLRHYKVFALDLPDSLTFAGEPVPLESFDLAERMDRELMVNTYWQSSTMLYLKQASRWFPLISGILKEEKVPDDFKYLSLIESGFRNVVSPSGATGFWQLLEGTARDYGLEVGDEVDERYHVEKATRAACRYLRGAHALLGSWTMAAASYNMGMAGVQRQVEKQQTGNYYELLLNEETSRYLFRILAVKEICLAPERYGFTFRQADLYRPLESYTVIVDSSITDMAAFAAHFGISYKTLKLFNPWLRQASLTNVSRKAYKVSVPRETPGNAALFGRGRAPVAPADTSGKQER